MPSSNSLKDDSIHEHHQMDNTKIKLGITANCKQNGDSLLNQQKQEVMLSIAQIVISFLQY